jgi:hypothetical protein
LLGDDHVGVDIDHRQISGDPGQRGEFLHGEPRSDEGLFSLKGARFPEAKAGGASPYLRFSLAEAQIKFARPRDRGAAR